MTAEQLSVLLVAFGYAAFVAIAGLVLLVLLRRGSLRGYLLLASVITVVSVVAGVVGAARAMFISEHDLGVILPVTLAAALVAMTVSWLLGLGIVGDVRLVRERARSLSHGDLEVGDPQTSPVATSAPTTSAATTSAATTGTAATGQIERPRLREFADIDAEIVAAGARLNQARQRERDLEVARRELVAWISHDLRTPLAGMRAMIEALEDGLAPDPERYHRQIHHEVDRLSRLVDDLFQLSRIQAGVIDMHREYVDLRDLVEDVLSATGPAATAAGVQLQAAADPVSVRADARGMARVLTNLVDNAIRYTRDGGVVGIEARLAPGDVAGSQDAVRISVSDGCGGIAPADLPHLFHAGWRGHDDARTPVPTNGHAARGYRSSPGAGLGLAIAQGIVEAHDGVISARNVDGGCRFEVVLPTTGR